jgi:trk system potassium uptake protein TrkH
MKKDKLLNIKLVSYVLGTLLFFEAGFLLISALVALLYGENDLLPLFISFGITLMVALCCFLLFRKEKSEPLNKREGYLVVTFVWIIFSLFGSLPFFFSGYIPSYTDAFFETISGFTTTGASILTDVERLPHGLLFWRSIIQWLGGMGIIVLSLAIMPIFGIGGMQLYVAEVPGPTKDKLRPRVAQTAKLLWSIYALLTVIEILLLCVGGMNLYDSICHAFTTMSTGGFSTKNTSISYWNSPFIEYIIILFMLIAGINYTVIYFAIKGNFKKLIHNEELKFYLLFALGFSVITMTALLITQNFEAEEAFRVSSFQVISVMTGTGFATADYMQWIPFLWTLMFVIMLIGGCAGSASGGLKTVRVALLLKNSYSEFKRLLHPNAVIPVKFNQKVVPSTIVTNVLAFIVLYAIIAVISLLVFVVLGIEFLESAGTVVSCLSNVGPGLGAIGPSGNYAHFPDMAKWYMSFLMLTGRLEVFTVLFLLAPSFWKK